MKIKLNFKALVQELKRLKIVIRPILAAISVLLIIGFYTGDLGRFVDRHEKTIIKAVRTLFFLPDKNIIFPNYKSQSGKFVNLLKDQWMGDKGNFILVSKKEAPFFNKPSLESQKLGVLPYTKRVQLLFVLEESRKDSNVLWGFITYEGGKAPIGWINLEDLARPSSFTQINEWDYDDFIYEKGDYKGDVHVNEEGQFFIKWIGDGGGLILKGKYFGRFYSFDNILWAKKRKFNIWKDFFYEEEDKLNQEFRFSRDKIKHSSQTE